MSEQAVKETTSKNKAWIKVYQAIREDIINSRYKPGDTLSEIDIASELDMSRTPVTMALNIMEREELVINRNGKKEIKRLSIDEVRTLFDTKIALQSELSKLAAERRNDSQNEELNSLIKEIREYLNSNFDDNGINNSLAEKWLPMDRRFHRLISDMADSPMMTKILGDCDIKWHTMRLNIIALGERTKKNAREHILLGESIINGNEQKASELTRFHLSNLRDSVLHVMEAFS